jgi:hypothetical protein
LQDCWQGIALANLPAVAQTNAPASGADQGSGMMQRGMPSGDGVKPGMIMDQGMPQKMSRMMESRTPRKDGTPTPSVRRTRADRARGIAGQAAPAPFYAMKSRGLYHVGVQQ